MNSELPADEPVDETDRAAGRRALARNWPNLDPASAKYSDMLEALAGLHRFSGADRFELQYRLRSPKTREEEWAVQFFTGQITQEKYAALVEADATRPIDLEMLNAFSEAYLRELTHYSDVLQNAVFDPEAASTSARRANEKAIDEHVAAMRVKLPLWSENLLTVFEFLDELRITSGAGLLKLGLFEGTSAHWLASQIFKRLKEAWQSCKEISERSRRDPRYIYEASAIDIFRQHWLSKFPAAQSISERLREETILARASLKKSLQPAIGLAARVDPATDPEALVTASAKILESKQMGNKVIVYGDVIGALQVGSPNATQSVMVKIDPKVQEAVKTIRDAIDQSDELDDHDKDEVSNQLARIVELAKREPTVKTRASINDKLTTVEKMLSVATKLGKIVGPAILALRTVYGHL